jgi:hypothetical protein
MFELQRTVKRRIRGRWITALFWVCFTALAALVTVINVAAVGYEIVPIYSLAYNATYELWYEKFIPLRIRPQTRWCEPSVIQTNEGTTLGCLRLIVGLGTNVTGLVQYFLIDYLTPSTFGPVNGMIYENTVIENCSVVLAEMVQSLSGPVQDQVR